MLASSGSRACSATNSGIQVLPNWQTSGVASPAKAVRSFSCAALQGSCWTSIRMPGCACSNSGRSAVTTSLSRPMAQKRTTFWSAGRGLQPAAITTAPIAIRRAREPLSKSRMSRVSGAIARGRRGESLRRGQPTAGETGPLQAAPQVQILFHDAPDQRRALVFDHSANGSLIDAEVIAVDPAESGDAAAVAERNVEVEA